MKVYLTSPTTTANTPDVPCVNVSKLTAHKEVEIVVPEPGFEIWLMAHEADGSGPPSALPLLSITRTEEGWEIYVDSGTLSPQRPRGPFFNVTRDPE